LAKFEMALTITAGAREFLKNAKGLETFMSTEPSSLAAVSAPRGLCTA
jgi:hypothetical protein